MSVSMLVDRVQHGSLHGVSRFLTLCIVLLAFSPSPGMGQDVTGVARQLLSKGPSHDPSWPSHDLAQ